MILFNPMSTEPNVTVQEQDSTSQSPITRWKAALIHLGLSAFVAICVVLLIYFVWYPQPFFDASGGKFLMTLLVGVDVVLGPLITLIIFDVKKKSLKLDLAIVAIVQMAAIVYGVYTMYLARPAFVVFAGDEFIVVTANDIEPDFLAKVTHPEFKSLPLTGPKYAYNAPPLSGTDFLAMTLSLQGLAPQFYIPYREKSTDAVKEGKPLADLYKGWPHAKADVEGVLQRQNRREADVVFVKVVAKLMVMAAILDAKSGAILSIVPLNKL